LDRRRIGTDPEVLQASISNPETFRAFSIR